MGGGSGVAMPEVVEEDFNSGVLELDCRNGDCDGGLFIHKGIRLLRYLTMYNMP